MHEQRLSKGRDRVELGPENFASLDKINAFGDNRKVDKGCSHCVSENSVKSVHDCFIDVASVGCREDITGPENFVGK